MSNDVASWTGNADHHSQYTQQWVDASSSAYASVDERSVIPEAQDQGFATQLYRTCLHVFRHLCNEAKDHGSQGLRLSSLKDELAKLYLWGEDFGGAELDDVLEHSEDIRKVVLELLGDIGRTLLREKKALLLKAGAKLSPQYDPSASLPAQQQTVELRKLVDQIKSITNIKSDNETREDQFFCIDGDDTDEDSSSDDDDCHDTLEDLEFSTRRLVELGPALHQNLYYVEKARLQFSRPPAVPFSVSEPAWIYVSHVREKFNQAQTRLVERLGEANWQRHRDVRRRMDAIANPNEDHDDEHEHGQEDGITCSVFYSSVAFHDSGIGTSVPAQTFYAQSHTSFQSNNTEGEQGSLRVPDTPTEVSEGKAFKCFLCGQMLSKIKSRVDWKLHVFADLKPYICTFTDCEHELAQFQNRAAWAEHEFNEHRLTKLWICPECPKECPSLATWEAHLQEQHERIFSGPHRQLAQRMAYRPQERPIEVEECPLCRSVLGKPRREFVKHVGRHMEQIALMTLPREATDDSDAESACTAQENSSHASIGSKRRSPRRNEGRNAGISVSDDELDAVSPQGSIGKAHYSKEHWRDVHKEITGELNSPWFAWEQAKFFDLLRQFGSDFGAIAESMETKTATMVRDFYNRKVAEGSEFGRNLEKTVQVAELIKSSTEEDDRPHIHAQPAYDPQEFSTNIFSAMSPSIPLPELSAHIRPQHPKVFCDKCNIKPEGFNGPHELRRHVENNHALHRTVWICVDRSPDKKFLSRCKQCVEGKQYGANFNALAHLRRIHFLKKSKSSGRGRGGDDGGDDPPLEILKEWVQRVSVPNDPQMQRSYETQNSPYHLENDTMGAAAAAAAAAAGNQLEMNSSEGIDEQETGISDTALGRLNKVPDHVSITPNTEALQSRVDTPDPRPFDGLFGPPLFQAEIGTSLSDYQYDAADNKRPTTSSASLARLNTGDLHAPPPGTSATQIGAAEHLQSQIHQTKTSQQPEQPSSPLYFHHWQPPDSQSNSEAPYLETPNRVDPFAQQAGVSVDKPSSPLYFHHWQPPDSQSNSEAPYLETPNRVDPLAQQAGVSVDEKSQGRSPQEALKKTRGRRRMLTASQREKVAAMRKTGVCHDCRKRKVKCKHGLPGDSMDHEDLQTPFPLTSSMMPWNSPHRSPQTTPSTSDPTQKLPYATIDDPRSRIPPFPLSQPVDTEPPSDNGLDYGESPQPSGGVRGWGEIAKEDDQLRGTRFELPAGWPSPDWAKVVERSREPMDSYEDWEH